MHQCINITWWVSFCSLCVYGFESDHFVLVGQSMRGFIPTKDKSSFSQQSIAFCNSLSRSKISQSFPSFHANTSIVWPCLCSYFYKRVFHSRRPGILALMILLLRMFYDIPWATDARTVIWMYTQGLGPHDPLISALWFSVIAFICCKERLFCGYKDKI